LNKTVQGVWAKPHGPPDTRHCDSLRADELIDSPDGASEFFRDILFGDKVTDFIVILVVHLF
jgi:hypothetical protein